jgi:hypothetical protein
VLPRDVVMLSVEGGTEVSAVATEGGTFAAARADSSPRRCSGLSVARSSATARGSLDRGRRRSPGANAGAEACPP